MIIKASFELLVPTVNFGNAKLGGYAEDDIPDEKNIETSQLNLNKQVLKQVLEMKKDLDKLPASTFIVNK